MLYKFQHRGIFCEIAIPKNKNKKIIILLPGLPDYPRPKEIMEEFSKQGYYVIYPRYRGTFESEGNFLKNSPAEDILEIINAIKSKKVFIEFYNKKNIEIDVKNIIIIGSSFGGSVAIHLAELSKDIDKLIIGCPVIDYKKHNSKDDEQDLHNFKRFLFEGFPNLYRFEKKNFDKLLNGEVIPPIWNLKKYENKLYLIHGKKDSTVSIKNSELFKKINKNVELYSLKNEGHLSIIKLCKLDIIIKILKE